MELKSTKDEQIILKTYKNGYKEWGYPSLTLEQYIAREKVLLKQDFAKGLECWVLFDKDQLVASCETYTRPCIAKLNGKLIKGDCIAIASVVTPPDHRRKGYASKMMDLLKEEIKKRAIASILYSDIGPDFYHEKGWKYYQSTSLVFDAKSMPSFTTEIEQSMVGNFIKTIELQENEFVIVPTIEAFDWILARSNYYATIFEKVIKAVGCSSNQDYFLWMHNFKESALLITHYSVTRLEDAMELLKSAANTAKKYELSKVEIWDPSELLLDASKVVQGQKVNRQDSLSSLLFFDAPDHTFSWKWNEKYAWV